MSKDTDQLVTIFNNLVASRQEQIRETFGAIQRLTQISKGLNKVSGTVIDGTESNERVQLKKTMECVWPKWQACYIKSWQPTWLYFPETRMNPT